MKEEMKHLYSKAAQKLQIPYEEYLALKEKSDEAVRLRQLKSTVIANLQAALGIGEAAPVEIEKEDPTSRPEPVAKPVEVKCEPVIEAANEVVESEDVPEEVPEKVSIEFSAAEEQKPVDESAKTRRPVAGAYDLPPLKEDIARKFNDADGSGRLFNVFTQYYTCLNDVCGGTVRVTMKDGVCSFWNYDAWEEFAFVDIFEGELRIAVDAVHTDALEALQLCEVPRLLAMRKNLVCVKVGGLNQTVLDVLATAFKVVETAAN